MKFVITARLIVSSIDVDSAADTMEAVDGVIYGAFKRVIEPLIDGQFSLATETTLEPEDEDSQLAFPDTPMGKMLSTGSAEKPSRQLGTGSPKAVQRAWAWETRPQIRRRSRKRSWRLIASDYPAAQLIL
ncbi:MAG: hypothetical protein ACP5H2_08780 [Solirubrobacteraceae bacterium]